MTRRWLQYLLVRLLARAILKARRARAGTRLPETAANVRGLLDRARWELDAGRWNRISRYLREADEMVGFMIEDDQS